MQDMRLRQALRLEQHHQERHHDRAAADAEHPAKKPTATPMPA